MAEDPREVLKRNRALLRARKETEESEQLLEKLPQGHGSGLNADMVDGLHAAEIIARAPGKGGGGGGSNSGSGDMTKAVYDVNENGVVDNSENLGGKTLAEVQDHEPKAHTLASHSSKNHSELTGVTADQHHAQLHGDADHSVTYEKQSNKDIAGGYCGLDASILILLARLPTIPYSKLNLALSIVNADIAAAAAIAESKLALNYATHAQLHKNSHKTGGGDALVLEDLLDAVARVKVRKNNGASDVGARRRLNLIEGSNVTLTVSDDPTNEEVDVTIASSGGGAAESGNIPICLGDAFFVTNVKFSGTTFDFLDDQLMRLVAATVTKTGTYRFFLQFRHEALTLLTLNLPNTLTVKAAILE
jgi:hypothetical protein